jgi:mRNA-degrading endonuclease YafQ of YafQ-DinJ toxin-antitoxin module
MNKILSFIALFLLISFTLSYAGWTPLKDYKAKNEEEEAIVNVLKGLSEGWKKKDKQQILSFFHENAQFVNMNLKLLSKDQMIQKEFKDWGLPRAWYDYYDIEIKIDGDKATLNALQMTSAGNFPVNLQMLRENQKWSVLKYEWKP